MRRAPAVAAVGAATLSAAPEAFARAGGGSSHFSGGGGGFHGGGGGFGGRGGGHFIFFGGGGGGAAIFVIIVIAIILIFVVPRVLKWWRGQQTAGAAARKKVAERERRVELAAAEASEDDAAFAPETVRAQGAKLFRDVQEAWDANDRAKLRQLVAPELLGEWERRLDDFDSKGWRNRVQVVGEPTVQYVGLTNRDEDREDRAVVRIEATIKDYVEDQHGQRLGRTDNLGDSSTVREFWTLAKSNGNWILQSIEQGAEGSHVLRDELVATAYSDEQSMRDEALVEGAVADALPEGTKVAEVADLDYDGDARAAANDLSVADGRFAPQVLEVAARRAVAAWAEAVDGQDMALDAIAHPEAVRELLHPGDPSGRTRLVVRGPEVRHIRIAALDAAAEPPTMTLELELAGRRYIEDRDTAAVISGSQSRATTFTERWTLALDGPSEQPWRIAAVGAAAGRT
jgi:predicted lipid-binding transport protein (Tim44 family)